MSLKQRLGQETESHDCCLESWEVSSKPIFAENAYITLLFTFKYAHGKERPPFPN